MSSDTQYIIITMLVGVLFPLYAIYEGKKVRNLLESASDKIVRTYKETIVMQLLLVGLVIAVVWYNAVSLNPIGLSFVMNPLWILGLFGLSLVMFWLVNRMAIDPEKREGLTTSYKDVLFLMPRTDREYNWAVAVSFVAGICEEIVFRGYLYWRLGFYISDIYAVLLVNVAFAASHYSTKFKNMVSSFLLGVVFSVAFIWSGSLWISIFLHIVVDLYSVTLGKKLLDLNAKYEES